MSGPSLRKRDAHSSIHEAALNEARELRELFGEFLHSNQKEKAIQVAEITIEHWESRTLKHAESEEEGLYKEIVEENNEMEKTVIQLTRDHDLMRRIVGEMKELLQTKEPDERITMLIDSLIIIDEIHNEDEMNCLLSNSER
ncbi:TPA: hemerythrin domain-containing protein [Bacillus toyonensis]|nr:hemerythrin domain-containing protein [Bacillus toyonensis]